MSDMELIELTFGKKKKAWAYGKFIEDKPLNFKLDDIQEVTEGDSGTIILLKDKRGVFYTPKTWLQIVDQLLGEANVST